MLEKISKLDFFFFLLVSSLTLFIYLFLKLITLQYHNVPESERLLLLT